MELDTWFDMLTKGFSEADKKMALDDYLNISNESDMEEDTAKYLHPGHGLDQKAINASLKVFAIQYPWDVVVLPTLSQDLEEAGWELPASEMDNFDIAMAKNDGKALRAVLWPFLIDNHFVLCVIRPAANMATIFDSMGVAHGETLVKRIKKWLDKYYSFREWHLNLGLSPIQDGFADSGIYCIANAAYTIADHPIPEAISVPFWRIACWAAMGLSTTDDYIAANFFGHLQAPSHDAIVEGVSRAKDEKQGLAVLRKLAGGPPRKWWTYWEQKLSSFILAFDQVKEARLAAERLPLLLPDLDKIEEDFVEKCDDLDRYEKSSTYYSRQEMIVQLAGVERLRSVVSRMEHLEDVIPAVATVMGN
ncbi:hypothetical protein QBC39DRAFT_384627 [Podospora conica]|nr:hypothetical protein QBC39DRAFT_384627 [Schizothecium conicum]